MYSLILWLTTSLEATFSRGRISFHVQHRLHLCLHNHFFKKELCPELTSSYYFYKATCVILREKLDSEITFSYGVKGYFQKLSPVLNIPFNNLLIWRKNQLVGKLTVSYYECTSLILFVLLGSGFNFMWKHYIFKFI